MHVHKDLLDTCDVVKVAKEFIFAKEECRKYFGIIKLLQILINFIKINILAVAMCAIHNI